MKVFLLFFETQNGNLDDRTQFLSGRVAKYLGK